MSTTHINTSSIEGNHGSARVLVKLGFKEISCGNIECLPQLKTMLCVHLLLSN
ncbi:MAG TPA: hypothetical protein DCX08_03830 [Porticoccaceae bacterium]|nr:hypothetical protein [Porticoccaceae bacterium]